MGVARISTPWGRFTAYFSAQGLARLHFPGAGVRVHFQRKRPSSRGLTPLADRSPPSAVVLRRWVRLTRTALREALSGRETKDLPALDLSAGTPFQRRVWVALRRIPVGQTRTYGQVAGAIGQPSAARAVGGACGANPIPVLVPCHRVTAAHGVLGGFSGGLRWKVRLLAREGVRLKRGPGPLTSPRSGVRRVRTRRGSRR